VKWIRQLNHTTKVLIIGIRETFSIYNFFPAFAGKKTGGKSFSPLPLAISFLHCCKTFHIPTNREVLKNFCFCLHFQFFSRLHVMKHVLGWLLFSGPSWKKFSIDINPSNKLPRENSFRRVKKRFMAVIY
jgi:hypothetical protein